MQHSLKRIRLGAIVLTTTFVSGVLGYRMFGRGWVEAVYMTATTISTVGFTERSELAGSEQLFVVALIVVGISAAVYTLGGLLNMMATGDIERALGVFQTRRSIESLSQHVIVCGYGRLGRMLAEELERQKCPFVIVEMNPEHAAQAAVTHLAHVGDATEEEVLKAVGIERARTVVTTLSNDAANVFITLTSRNLNPKLQIIARGESLATQRKLHQAGADRVVLPASIGAQRIAAIITRPSTIELLELVAGQAMMDVEVNEVVIPAASALVGKTVLATEMRRRHRLLIVAVKQEQGGMIFNPDGDFVFSAGDTVIVMGKPADIALLRADYGL
jgi:voltage-gated potassium channel